MWINLKKKIVLSEGLICGVRRCVTGCVQPFDMLMHEHPHYHPFPLSTALCEELPPHLPLLHANQPHGLCKIYLGAVFFSLCKIYLGAVFFSLTDLFKNLPPHPLLHGLLKRDNHNPICRHSHHAAITSVP